MARIYHHIHLTMDERERLDAVLDVIGDVRELMKDYNTKDIVNLRTYEVLEDRDLGRIASFIEELYEGVWVMEEN